MSSSKAWRRRIPSVEGRLAAPRVAAPLRERPPLARLRAVLRGVAAVSGVLLFIFALEIIKAGARGIVPLLDGLDVHGPVNALGFGWLFAYAALSGSPVAAIGITLLAGGTFSETEAFAVVGGSRLGASFIVLAIGFVLYLSRRRDAEGLYIGIVALITTFTTQGPAILLGLLSLHEGWLDGVHVATPGRLLDVTDRLYGGTVSWLVGALPSGGVFIAGVFVLLGSFAVFDRALPQLRSDPENIGRLRRSLDRRAVMFLLGAGVTLVTLSVSISLTLLVPLSLKGFVRRDQIIPYVMGANITTFVDTLVASVLLGGDQAFVVVLTEMVAVTIVSLCVLTLLYRPYRRVVLGIAGWAAASPRHLGLFLGLVVGIPLALVLV